MIDFELALHNAFRKSFPGIEIRACFFHMVQNQRKQLQRLGLMKRAETELEMGFHVKLIRSLAYVKKEDLEQAFTLLDETVSDNLTEFLNYVEKYYIGFKRRSKFRFD
jgi:hypothetical protein